MGVPTYEANKTRRLRKIGSSCLYFYFYLFWKSLVWDRYFFQVLNFWIFWDYLSHFFMLFLTFPTNQKLHMFEQHIFETNAMGYFTLRSSSLFNVAKQTNLPRLSIFSLYNLCYERQNFIGCSSEQLLSFCIIPRRFIKYSPVQGSSLHLK